jgi:hypothetical protein
MLLLLEGVVFIKHALKKQRLGQARVLVPVFGSPAKFGLEAASDLHRHCVEVLHVEKTIVRIF